jgi:hypothetical protein
MGQIKSAAMVALGLCLFLAAQHATAPQPSATLGIEWRIGAPATRNRHALILIVKIGSSGTGTNSMRHWSPSQYFDSWCEAATEALLKRLHMA